MIPSEHQKTLGLMSLGRFVTTYSSDYKPFSERHPQVIQLKPRSEAEAAPALISPPQTDRETWPIFHQYKTTNSTYGSSYCSRPPSCSLFPAFLPPFGTLASSVSEASGVDGSTLTEAGTQEAGVARETGPLLGNEAKGHLRYVLGGKANVLEQHEAKDESQKKIDVLYEEGVIVLSSHVGPACCKDFLGSVLREAGLQHLLHLPVASSPIITIKDAESWDNSAFLRSTTGLIHGTFLQPTSSQCSCCAWETACSNSCCFKIQTFPRGSARSLAHARLTVYCTEPSGKPWLTEYQAHTAAWAQPKIQQSDFHHHHPPLCHQILYPHL